MTVIKKKKKSQSGTWAGWTVHQWMVIPELGPNSQLYSPGGLAELVFMTASYSNAVRVHHLNFSFLSFPARLNCQAFPACLLCLLVSYVPKNLHELFITESFNP